MKFSTAISAIALGVLVAQSAPATADIIVNNVFSPFSMTEVYVGSGHRVYSRGPWDYPYRRNYYTRCYNRWDPYFAEWRMDCNRRHYGRSYPY